MAGILDGRPAAGTGRTPALAAAAVPGAGSEPALQATPGLKASSHPPVPAAAPPDAGSKAKLTTDAPMPLPAGATLRWESAAAQPTPPAVNATAAQTAAAAPTTSVAAAATSPAVALAAAAGSAAAGLAAVHGSQAAAATAVTVGGIVMNHAAPMPPAGGGGKDAAGSGRQEQPSGQSKAATRPGPRLPALSANDGGTGAGGDKSAGPAAALTAGGEPAAPGGGKMPAAANAPGTGTAVTNTAATATPAAGAGTAAVQAAAPGGSAASHLAALLTAAAAPPNETPQAGNANKLTLTLHNDTLGAVAVQATLRPQGLEAAIQAARADTHAIMQQGLPLLQQTLTDHNIRLVNLIVSRGPASHSPAASSSGQRGARQAFAQTGGGRGQNQPGGGGSALARTAPSTAEGAPADRGPASGLARPGGAPAVAPGRLSIRV